MSVTVFTNARLVDPATALDGPGGLVVQGRTIADAGPHVSADSVPADAAVVDCAGAALVPGLVDMRVQLGEPGAEHKETIATGSAAAAAGGITRMAVLPNTSPPIQDEAGVELIARRAREAKGVKVHPYAALTRDFAGAELCEIGLLHEAGAVGFTDADRATADARVLTRALTYGRSFDALILQHPEEPALAAGGTAHAGELATRLGLSGIPAAAERIQIERDLRLVEMTGGRLHIPHLSTAGGVAAVRWAKRQGLDVTCDTAPIYFALNEAAIGNYRTFAKVSPPLRSEADRRAIAEAVADGTIDAIASDHCPQDQDSKRLPFGQADAGAAGLDSLLPLSLALVHAGRLSLSQLIDRLATAPARRLGVPGGTLAAGSPADLALIDLDTPWRLAPEAFRSKSKNSPLEAHPVEGRAVGTWVDGRQLYAADAGRHP